MKKLLSLILAVCMVISIAPAALATEATEGDATLSGVTVEYDIKSILAKGGNSTGAAANWGNSAIPASDFSYPATNGFFQYVGNSANTATVIDLSTIKWNSGGLYLKKSAWWAFKIYVPADGMYTPKVTYGHKASDSNTLFVSLVKVDSVSEINTNVINDNKLTISGSNAGIPPSSNPPTDEKWYPQSFDAEELTQGEYLLSLGVNLTFVPSVPAAPNFSFVVSKLNVPLNSLPSIPTALPPTNLTSVHLSPTVYSPSTVGNSSIVVPILISVEVSPFTRTSTQEVIVS